MRVAGRSFLSYSRAQEASADITALRLLEATRNRRGHGQYDGNIGRAGSPNEVTRPLCALALFRARVNAYVEGASKSLSRTQKTVTHVLDMMAKAKLYGF